MCSAVSVKLRDKKEIDIKQKERRKNFHRKRRLYRQKRTYSLNV